MVGLNKFTYGASDRLMKQTSGRERRDWWWGKIKHHSTSSTLIT